MGGHLSCMYAGMSSTNTEPSHCHSSRVLKVVIACEGRTCEFFEPVKVAELMIEFPNHFVAEYDIHTHHGIAHAPPTPATIAGVGTAVATVPMCSKRVSPLPADHDAKLSHVYLLLPMHRLNTRLSVEELNVISSLAAATPASSSLSHTKATHTSSKVTPLSAGHYQEAALHTTTSTTTTIGPVTNSASYGTNVSIAKSYSVPILELLEKSGSNEDFDGSQADNQHANQHLHILRSKSWTPKLETIIESSHFLYH